MLASVTEERLSLDRGGSTFDFLRSFGYCPVPTCAAVVDAYRGVGVRCGILHCEYPRNKLQAKYNFLPADFARGQMFNRIGNLLESSFPLCNHVWSDLSRLDQPRKFILDEVRQILALLIICRSSLILNAVCGVNNGDYEGSVGK